MEFIDFKKMNKKKMLLFLKKSNDFNNRVCTFFIIYFSFHYDDVFKKLLPNASLIEVIEILKTSFVLHQYLVFMDSWTK